MQARHLWGSGRQSLCYPLQAFVGKSPVDKIPLKLVLCELWQHHELLRRRQTRTRLGAVGGKELSALDSWICGTFDMQKKAHNVGTNYLQGKMQENGLFFDEGRGLKLLVYDAEL